MQLCADVRITYWPEDLRFSQGAVVSRTAIKGGNFVFTCGQQEQPQTMVDLQTLIAAVWSWSRVCPRSQSLMKTQIPSTWMEHRWCSACLRGRIRCAHLLAQPDGFPGSSGELLRSWPLWSDPRFFVSKRRRDLWTIARCGKRCGRGGFHCCCGHSDSSSH